MEENKVTMGYNKDKDNGIYNLTLQEIKCIVNRTPNGPLLTNLFLFKIITFDIYMYVCFFSIENKQFMMQGKGHS